MTYRTTTQSEPSLSELLTTLSGQARTLFRQEVQLAQVEMTHKATRAGRNAAFVAIGAVTAMGAFYALIAAVILGLSQYMEAWLAALLVGLVLALAAVILVRYGINKLRAMNLAPRQTIATVKENTEWLTQQI